jgi:hypothetical protein
LGLVTTPRSLCHADHQLAGDPLAILRRQTELVPPNDRRHIGRRFLLRGASVTCRERHADRDGKASYSDVHSHIAVL